MCIRDSPWTEGSFLSQLSSIDPHPVDVGRAIGFVNSTNNGGVFETTDNGLTWTPLSPLVSANGFDAAASQVGAYRPTTPTTIYALAIGVGFQHSTDGGLTWVSLNNGLQAYNMRAIEVHPTDSNYVYAGASDGNTALGGVYRSIDNGVTWSQSNAGLDLLGVRDICLLYTSPSPRDLSTSRMPSSA